MFNFQGSEIVIILLLALVVLGPEKLPEAMRKAGQMYGELKKLSSSFQSEFRSVIEEPVKEAKATADLLRDSADFTTLQAGQREEKPKSAEMTEASAMNLAPADPDAVPTDELPFVGESHAPAGSDAFGDLPTPRARPDASPGDAAEAS